MTDDTDTTRDGFDLHSTFVHLSVDARATAIPDFSWAPEAMAGYARRFAADGAAGRLVGLFHQDAAWPTWERHPAGEELVVLLSGRADLIQELDGREHRIPLLPGQGALNPPGVWHTADVYEPGDLLFVTAGEGTEHRER